MDLLGYAAACIKRQHLLKLKVLGFRIGVGDLPDAMLRLLPVNNVLVEIRKVPKPVTVRIRTADPSIFKRIFTSREYDYGLPADPQVIIDGGANVGYLVAWYKARFPKATIIAIEPNHDNFRMLQRNCGELPNVYLLHGAIWSEDTTLTLCHRGSEDKLLTSDTGAKPKEVGAEHVRGISLNTIISEYHLDRVDILKLDIEGAEKEVFEAENRQFVNLVDCFAIECRDQFKPGCVQAVDNALKHSFRQSSNGKKLFYHRSYPLAPAIRSTLERNIWLVSDGRSGSTWISSLINHRQFFAEYFEPLHAQQTPELKGEPLIRYARSGELPQLYRYLYGRILQKKWSSQWSGPKYAERSRVLIKDIHALLLAKALAAEAPTLDVVCLVRDPVHVAVSKLRQGARARWFGEPAQLLADAALRHDWLSPFEDEIRGAETQFEKYVILWAIMYHVITRQFGQSISYIRYHDSYALIRESIGSILEQTGAPQIEDSQFGIAFSDRSKTDDPDKIETYEPTDVEVGYAQHIVKLFDLEELLAPRETSSGSKKGGASIGVEIQRHMPTFK